MNIRVWAEYITPKEALKKSKRTYTLAEAARKLGLDD